METAVMHDFCRRLALKRNSLSPKTCLALTGRTGLPSVHLGDVTRPVGREGSVRHRSGWAVMAGGVIKDGGTRNPLTLWTEQCLADVWG